MEKPRQGTLTGIIETCVDSGILYSEFLRECRKTFITTVLLRHKLNQCKAAIELGMHRNTLSRTIAELKIDLAALRSPKRKTVQRSAEPGPLSAAMAG